MKRWERAAGRAVLGVAGLAVVAYLVRDAGWQQVEAVLWQAGRWLPVVMLLEAVQLGCDVVALRTILREHARAIPPVTWLRSSLVSYAMMVLLPAGRAAGEVARATMFSATIGVSRAATTSTALQAGYLAANGLLSIVACAVVSSRLGVCSTLALLLAGNFVFQAIVASSLVAILRDARMGRWLGRIRERLMPSAEKSPPLDPVDRRRVPWRACLVSTFGRSAQVVQYGVVLHAVGGALTATGAFVAHGIHLVGATVGDVLPNQAGVTDGAYRAFAADLGFADEPARSLDRAGGADRAAHARGGERRRGGGDAAAFDARAIASIRGCRRPFVARTLPEVTKASPPSGSVTRPPASRTSSAPAAMSQGFRPSSKKTANRPAATYARSSAAAASRRTPAASRMARASTRR